MASMYDDERVQLKCQTPGCMTEFSAPLRVLAINPNRACPVCGTICSLTHLGPRLAKAMIKKIDGAILRRHPVHARREVKFLN
jgi:hypothetical protein